MAIRIDQDTEQAARDGGYSLQPEYDPEFQDDYVLVYKGSTTRGDPVGQVTWMHGSFWKATGWGLAGNDDLGNFPTLRDAVGAVMRYS